MKRIILLLLAIILFSTPSWAADSALTVGDPKLQGVRQFYVTGATAIASSLAPATMGTQVFELVSIEIHLSAVGTAASFTATLDSALGAAYDTVLFTQDMTAVLNLLQLYEPGEAVFSSSDEIDFAWANASSRTYGLTVKYRLR